MTGSGDDRKGCLLLLPAVLAVVGASAIIVLVSASRPYSIGEHFLLWLIGLPIGILIAYIWYFIVFSLAFPRLPGKTTVVKRGEKYAYLLLIALLTSIIDSAYYSLIWEEKMGQLELVPAVSLPFQFLMILVPMAMLWLLIFTLSYTYLGLEKKQSVILGVIMAFFTSSWMVLAFPFITGRVMV